jgi:hypothetical protein
VRESQGASLPQRLQLTNSVNIPNACVSILMDAARQYVWTILKQSVGIKMVDIRNDPLVSGTAMT